MRLPFEMVGLRVDFGQNYFGVTQRSVSVNGWNFAAFPTVLEMLFFGVVPKHPLLRLIRRLEALKIKMISHHPYR